MGPISEILQVAVFVLGGRSSSAADGGRLGSERSNHHWLLACSGFRYEDHFSYAELPSEMDPSDLDFHPIRPKYAHTTAWSLFPIPLGDTSGFETNTV